MRLLRRIKWFFWDCRMALREVRQMFEGAVITDPTTRAAAIETAVSKERERLVGALHDFSSHRAAWRKAIDLAIENSPDEDDISYWSHELVAFDNAHATLESERAK